MNWFKIVHSTVLNSDQITIGIYLQMNWVQILESTVFYNLSVFLSKIFCKMLELRQFLIQEQQSLNINLTRIWIWINTLGLLVVDIKWTKKERTRCLYIHGLFQVFMAHRREKNGHIAPLQKCLIKDILSLFDKEQVQGGFQGMQLRGNYLAENENKTTINRHIAS